MRLKSARGWIKSKIGEYGWGREKDRLTSQIKVNKPGDYADLEICILRVLSEQVQRKKIKTRPDTTNNGNSKKAILGVHF